MSNSNRAEIKTKMTTVRDGVKTTQDVAVYADSPVGEVLFMAHDVKSVKITKDDGSTVEYRIVRK